MRLLAISQAGCYDFLPNHLVSGLANGEIAKEYNLNYLRTFLEGWNNELEPDSEFAWRVLSPPSGAALLMARFTTRYKKSEPVKSRQEETEDWHKILANLEKDARVQADSSRIFIDTFFRYVSGNEILFIKRNEQRFWTRTAAREDAESALAYLMNLENDAQGGKQ